MLSALLQLDPQEVSNINHDAGSAKGFGKMLNSLHGLQQRLDDFSISDVTDAEANSHTLVRRLRKLQDTIATVAQVKNAAADVNQAIAEIGPIDTDVVRLDSLENHPQLHAIVKATKLIKLHKLMAALKAGARADEPSEILLDDKPAVLLPIVESATNSAIQGLDAPSGHGAQSEWTVSEETVDAPIAAVRSLKINATTSATHSGSPVLETAPNARTLAFADPEQLSFETRMATGFPTAEAESESSVIAVGKTSIGTGDALLADFPAPTEWSADSLATTNPPPSFEPKHGRGAQIEVAKQHESHAADTDSLDASKALVPANESFDLRLLDDLVSNYGDFAAHPHLPATIEKKENHSDKPAARAAEKIQLERPSPVESSTEMVKSNSDLDRQLKKIIKDYGENDLYANTQTTNLKKAGIIAFAVLGLVFGGIYLFKAPPSTAKTTVPAAAGITPGATLDQPKSQPRAQGENGNRRETVIGPTPKVGNPNGRNK